MSLHNGYRLTSTGVCVTMNGRTNAVAQHLKGGQEQGSTARAVDCLTSPMVFDDGANGRVHLLVAVATEGEMAEAVEVVIVAVCRQSGALAAK